MRDLLVCKQCEKFEPLLLKYPKVDTVLKGWFEWNNVARCNRMHGCFNDDFSVRHGDYLKDTEYFNLDNSKRTCPYFVEHEMYYGRTFAEVWPCPKKRSKKYTCSNERCRFLVPQR